MSLSHIFFNTIYRISILYSCILTGNIISASLLYIVRFLLNPRAEPHSSVGRVADLRTGDRWFDPQLGQYSFRGMMIVIATGVIPLSPLFVVLTMVIWEISQWLGRNIVWSTD